MAFNKYMHPRNIYKVPADFQALAEEYPEFKKHAMEDSSGKVHLNFKDAASLKALTTTLLHKDFGLNVDIPANHLVPALPSRLNYIHWLEDLLQGLYVEPDRNIRVLDIGTGSCCIYALLGTMINDWHFVGTDICEDSIKVAKDNINKNNLQAKISVHKVCEESIFKEILESVSGKFDFSMCNPPFFRNEEEANSMSKNRSGERDVPRGSGEGEAHEKVTEGGELEFVQKMILESKKYGDRIRIFSSMVGCKKNFLELKTFLEDSGVRLAQSCRTEFCQGRTMRWGLAWTWEKKLQVRSIPIYKRTKEKPPLRYNVPDILKEDVTSFYSKVKSFLDELEIEQEELTIEKRLVSVRLLARENTWSYQRQKRRMAVREDEDEIHRHRKRRRKDRRSKKRRIRKRNARGSKSSSSSSTTTSSACSSSDDSCDSKEENAKRKAGGIPRHKVKRRESPVEKSMSKSKSGSKEDCKSKESEEDTSIAEVNVESGTSSERNEESRSVPEICDVDAGDSSDLEIVENESYGVEVVDVDAEVSSDNESSLFGTKIQLSSSRTSGAEAQKNKEACISEVSVESVEVRKVPKNRAVHKESQSNEKISEHCTITLEDDSTHDSIVEEGIQVCDTRLLQSEANDSEKMADESAQSTPSKNNLDLGKEKDSHSVQEAQDTTESVKSSDKPQPEGRDKSSTEGSNDVPEAQDSAEDESVKSSDEPQLEGRDKSSTERSDDVPEAQDSAQDESVKSSDEPQLEGRDKSSTDAGHKKGSNGNPGKDSENNNCQDADQVKPSGYTEDRKDKTERKNTPRKKAECNISKGKSRHADNSESCNKIAVVGEIEAKDDRMEEVVSTGTKTDSEEEDAARAKNNAEKEDSTGTKGENVVEDCTGTHGEHIEQDTDATKGDGTRQTTISTKGDKTMETVASTKSDGTVDETVSNTKEDCTVEVTTGTKGNSTVEMETSTKAASSRSNEDTANSDKEINESIEDLSPRDESMDCEVVDESRTDECDVIDIDYGSEFDEVDDDMEHSNSDVEMVEHSSSESENSDGVTVLHQQKGRPLYHTEKSFLANSESEEETTSEEEEECITIDSDVEVIEDGPPIHPLLQKIAFKNGIQILRVPSVAVNNDVPTIHPSTTVSQSSNDSFLRNRMNRPSMAVTHSDDDCVIVDKSPRKLPRSSAKEPSKPPPILKCTLYIRDINGRVVLELNFIEGSRDAMNGILMYIRNKIIRKG